MHTINISDKDYPANLKGIYAPPKALYVNGALEKDDRAAIAIVGSRAATPYGLSTAYRLAGELASFGITVVSGLAVGIDTEAHKGALDRGGRTIAVLGSGLDVIYPPENKKLAQRIEKQGAVISEFPLGTPPNRYNFPRRNRIISGFSLGVVVVEASKDSGALITAKCALDENREVFAVPGKAGSVTSEGTHQLIKDGARLVENGEDIIEELGLELKRISDGRAGKSFPDLEKDEEKIFEALSDEPLHIDEIAEAASFDASLALKTLSSLELKGAIKQLPGKRFVRR